MARGPIIKKRLDAGACYVKPRFWIFNLFIGTFGSYPLSNVFMFNSVSVHAPILFFRLISHSYSYSFPDTQIIIFFQN